MPPIHYLRNKLRESCGFSCFRLLDAAPMCWIEQCAEKIPYFEIILTDIAVAIRVTILVVMFIFAFHFPLKNSTNDNDVTFAGVCTKQSCYLVSGE